jgi:hypothetical protein
MPHSKSIAEAFQHLSELDDLHTNVGKEVFTAYGGALYGMDFLAIGALNRSKAHVSGFTSLLKAKNLICAGALLRLQLDTAMRFYAAFLVEDPHGFAMKVMGGEKIRKLRDKGGNALTDSYLARRLGEEYEWVPRVYEKTSGYVHLSATHLMSSLSAKNDESQLGKFEAKIAAEDKDLPESLYVETVDAFSASTEILLRYVRGWAFTKDNPDVVRAARTKEGDHHDA